MANQQPSPESITGEGSTTIAKASRVQADSKQETLEKVCRVCMTAKPLDHFYVRSESGLTRRECKDCIILRQRERDLGVTEAEYQALFEEQQGKCGICERQLDSKRYTRFAVDHCHRTKRVRGLLCGNCNAGLGFFKDSPKRLSNAIAYLGKI